MRNDPPRTVMARPHAVVARRPVRVMARHPIHVMAQRPIHVMAGLDPAIALSIPWMPMARSSRANTGMWHWAKTKNRDGASLSWKPLT